MLTLKKGDKVAIVAPASYLRDEDRRFARSGAEVLLSWGLEVVEFFDLAERHFYFAGTDEYRFRQLQSALEAPDIKGIFCTRGGYGSVRLLNALSELELSHPRLFCGFSDITALTIAFEKYFPSIIHSIHGPNVCGISFVADNIDAEMNRQCLHDLLFYGEQGLEQTLQVLSPGYALAPISGGCLSVIASLLGTSFEPDFSGKILFLEDVGEKPYSIDRMLTQLKQAGMFAGIKGLIVGDMHGCTDQYNDLPSVIADVMKGAEFPILYGFKAGHGPLNRAFAYGQLAEIDSSAQVFRLLRT